MSALLRLYPRAWRERYGDEIVALLGERPPTLKDQFDLIRGAIDGFPVLGLIAARRGSRNGVTPNWLTIVFAVAGAALFVGSLGSIENDPGLLRFGSVGVAALALAWVAVSGRAADTSTTSPA